MSAFLAAIATPTPPALDLVARAGTLAEPALEERVAAWCDAQALPAPRRPYLRCLALLYHDHLPPAHVLCQEREDADGNWLHAILHRREGDFDNARWWFRRVGVHPAAAALASRAADEGLEPWDGERSIDGCERLARQPRGEGTSAWRRDRQAAMRAQQLEFEQLADWLVRSQG